MARRLARAGRRVVVLESGKAVFDQHSQSLNTIVDIGGRYTRPMDGRYRGLGGSSMRWGGRLVPIYASDASERRHIGAEGWPFSYSELEGYLSEIEDEFGVAHGAFGAPAVESVGLGDVFPSRDEDFTSRLAKWINYRNCNLATLWGRELRNSENLAIFLDATVNEIHVDADAGRLKALEAHSLSGGSVRVAADHFIIAAGTIESTRLLLWLDRQAGDQVFGRGSVLGRYFQDHLKAEVATVMRPNQDLGNHLFGYHYIKGTRRSLHLDFTQQAQEKLRTSSAFVYPAMDLSSSGLARIKAVARSLQSGQFNMWEVGALLGELPLVAQAAYWRFAKRQVFMPSTVRIGMQIAIEQRPKWDNHIALATETDRFGVPKVALDWSPQPEDEACFRAVANRLRAYWSRTGLDRSFPLSWLIDPQDTSGAFCDAAQPYAHPSGSTRMGTDPATSVVDPDLVCHSVHNLSVVSASVFPNAGSANPTLTILQLALRHADWLLARVRRPLAVTSVSA